MAIANADDAEFRVFLSPIAADPGEMRRRIGHGCLGGAADRLATASASMIHRE